MILGFNSLLTKVKCKNHLQYHPLLLINPKYNRYFTHLLFEKITVDYNLSATRFSDSKFINKDDWETKLQVYIRSTAYHFESEALFYYENGKMRCLSRYACSEKENVI